MLNTIVISAFPGCGKSYFHKNNKEYVSLDSDSSNYSWIKDDHGNNTTTRNPEFPNNYIKHIKDNIGKVDIIFVSSHDVVREALIENKIKHFAIYPCIELKDLYMNNYIKRGNDKNFIEMMDKNFNKFINSIEKSKHSLNVTKIVLDKSYPYLDNYIIKHLVDIGLDNR